MIHETGNKMSKKKVLTTEEQVRRLNELARKMAENEALVHPSAWAEQNADLMEEWRSLAACETYEPPVQLGLGLE